MFESLAGLLLNLVIIWDGLKSAWKSPSNLWSDLNYCILCLLCIYRRADPTSFISSAANTDLLKQTGCLPWHHQSIFKTMSNTQLCRHCPIRPFIDVVPLIQSLLPHQSQASFIQKCCIWIKKVLVLDQYEAKYPELIC